MLPPLRYTCRSLPLFPTSNNPESGEDDRNQNDTVIPSSGTLSGTRTCVPPWNRRLVRAASVRRGGMGTTCTVWTPPLPAVGTTRRPVVASPLATTSPEGLRTTMVAATVPAVTGAHETSRACPSPTEATR